MVEAAEEPLNYIFNAFKDNNKIDLRTVKGYFDSSTALPT